MYSALKDHKRLDLLPNWAYSYAMALFHVETAERKSHG